MVLGQPEGMGLATGMSGAETEHEAPSADLIERLRGLGSDPRIAVERGCGRRAVWCGLGTRLSPKWVNCICGICKNGWPP